MANGGILFFDEIGALPNRLQPKLLRLLQERRYERVGESITRLANVRVLAATQRDLEADVAQGRFRQDLLQRLSVICVTCLPLRQRTADILPLARHLLAFFARESGKPISAFSPEAEAALLAFDWPGNVRELRNAVEQAVILATGPTIGRGELPPHVASAPPDTIEVGHRVTVEQIVAEHIRRLVSSSATIQEAADILGIDTSTIWRKRKRHGM